MKKILSFCISLSLLLTLSAFVGCTPSAQTPSTGEAYTVTCTLKYIVIENELTGKTVVDTDNLPEESAALYQSVIDTYGKTFTQTFRAPLTQGPFPITFTGTSTSALGPTAFRQTGRSDEVFCEAEFSVRYPYATQITFESEAAQTLFNSAYVVKLGQTDTMYSLGCDFSGMKISLRYYGQDAICEPIDYIVDYSLSNADYFLKSVYWQYEWFTYESPIESFSPEVVTAIEKIGDRIFCDSAAQTMTFYGTDTRTYQEVPYIHVPIYYNIIQFKEQTLNTMFQAEKTFESYSNNIITLTLFLQNQELKLEYYTADTSFTPKPSGFGTYSLSTLIYRFMGQDIFIDLKNPDAEYAQMCDTLKELYGDKVRIGSFENIIKFNGALSSYNPVRFTLDTTNPPIFIINFDDPTLQETFNECTIEFSNEFRLTAAFGEGASVTLCYTAHFNRSQSC